MVAAIAAEDREQLQLERNVWSETGFVGVNKVGNKFQARLQVPGDGRGGKKKRRQHSLPGLFNSAEEAAVMRAAIKEGFLKTGDGKIHTPPKQNRPHKSRVSRPALPALPSDDVP